MPIIIIITVIKWICNALLSTWKTVGITENKYPINDRNAYKKKNVCDHVICNDFVSNLWRWNGTLKKSLLLARMHECLVRYLPFHLYLNLKLINQRKKKTYFSNEVTRCNVSLASPWMNIISDSTLRALLATSPMENLRSTSRTLFTTLWLWVVSRSWSRMENRFSFTFCLTLSVIY